MVEWLCPRTREKKTQGVILEGPLPIRLSASWLILCFPSVHTFTSHWFSVGNFSIDLNLNNEQFVLDVFRKPHILKETSRIQSHCFADNFQGHIPFRDFDQLHSKYVTQFSGSSPSKKVKFWARFVFQYICYSQSSG